jgi:hypothetical protein
MATMTVEQKKSPVVMNTNQIEELVCAFIVSNGLKAKYDVDEKQIKVTIKIEE